MKRSITYFISFVSLFCFSACSLFYKDNPTSSDLTGLMSAAQKSTIKVEGFTDLTRIYRLHGLSISDDIYFTAINECRKKGTSLQNLLSKMLVGFQSPAVTEQQNLALKDFNLLRTFVSTERNGEPLFMTIYTAGRSGCISDYALWSQADLGLLSDEDVKKLDTFVAELVNKK